ncbi:MAG TPA: hypothetical protein VHM92_05855 [Allosphingosinicella sp.]|nr:hypothetical protein [Allosphingosinicella sp.]
MKLANAAIPFALAAALALSACSDDKKGDNLADLGNDADPALTSALNDQILVDPNLANQSNRNAVRPPATPLQAGYPPPDKGEGAAASAAAAVQGGNGCSDASKFDYNSNWAGRLSAAFAVYPGGKVSEAAGNDKDGCRTRVVSFETAQGWQGVLDWYHTRAVKAGYSSEHQVREGDHILAGTNEKDGGAFYLIATPKGSGSEVSLITNNGR